MNKFFKLLFAGALVLAGASALSLAFPKAQKEVRATEGAGTIDDPYYATTFEELAYAVDGGHKDYIIVNEFEEGNKDVEGYYYVNPDYSKYSFNEKYQNYYFFFWQERSYHLTINCDIKIRQSVRHLNIRYLFYVSNDVNLTLDGTGSISFKVDEDGYYSVGIFEAHRNSNITINGDLTFTGIHENPKSTTYAFSTDENSHVVVNGGHFIGTGPSGYNGSHAFEYTCRNGSTLLITGGEFVVPDDIKTTTPTASLVIFDQNAANANNVTIKGGTFHGICVRNKYFNILDVLDPDYHFVYEDLTPFEEADVTSTRDLLICEPLPPVNYTVSFVGTGSATGSMTPQEVHSRTYTLPANEFEYSDDDPPYIFRGWAINDPDPTKGLYQPNEEILISGDLTLYSIWSQADTYEIAYDDRQGNTFRYYLIEGSTFTVWTFDSLHFKAPVGQRFVNWEVKYTNPKEYVNENDSYVVPDDNVYFQAVYESTGETVVYISFDNGGGEGSMDQISIVAGKNFVLPTNKVFSKGSAPFRGWDVPGIGLMNPLDIFRVTRNISITAVWGDPVAIEVNHPGINRLNAYVTYEDFEAYLIYSDGGRDQIDAATQLNFFIEENNGDYVPVNLMNHEEDVPCDRNFKARYYLDAGLEYDFTINFGDYVPMFFVSGLGDGKKVVLQWLDGETYPLPDYPFEIPQGSQFYGWTDAYGNDYDLGANYTVDKSNTFYARISGAKHTLSFDSGDGTGSMDSKLIMVNSKFYFPKCTFTAPVDKVFDHWEIDGGVFAAETPYEYSWDNDKVATAIYRDSSAVTYIVSYDANGGEGSIGAKEFVVGTLYQLPDSGDFTAPEGYEFDHWLVKSGSNDPMLRGPHDSFTVEDNTLIMPVWAAQLTSISVSGTYKTEYEIGESFDDTGVVVTGHYYDSSQDAIDLWEVEFTGFDSSTAGVKTITASYNGKTTTFDITVLPYKYSVTYSLNGGTGDPYVVNNVEDGSDYELLPFDTLGITPPDGLYFDHYEVQVGANAAVEKNPGETVEVTANTSVTPIWRNEFVSISVSGSYKTEYEIGEAFSSAGMVVNANYSDNTQVPVDLGDVLFSGFDSSTSGVRTITVSYSGKTTTFDITVLPAKYSITYVPNGGTGVNYVFNNVNDGTVHTLLTVIQTGFVAPEGKVFDCWLVGGVEKQPGQTITISENVTIQAKWKDQPVQPTQYNVSFSAGEGGSGEMAQVAQDENAVYTLPQSTFTAPANKEFAGWKVNGTGELLQPGQTITITADVQLVAQWKDIEQQGGGEVVPETPETPTTPDTPTTPEQPKETKGLSGGAIAGIVIGSVAVAGLGGFTLVWFVIKKKTFADLLAIFSKK